MRARFAAANALLKANTRDAVEAALDHFVDMLRLGRSDNLGVRDIIPSLMLRLGHEQQCYDFLKWWANQSDTTDHLDDTNLPLIDPFTAKYCLDLSQLVALTLLKMRMYLDVDSYENPRPWPKRAVGDIVKTRVNPIRYVEHHVSRLMQDLKKQYQALLKVVHDANSHFWEALVDDETRSPPESYSAGSPEEADLAVFHCKASWEESDDAMVMINVETCQFASVYVGANTVDGPRNTNTNPTNTNPTNTNSPYAGQVYTAKSLEKVLGTGRVIPSVFTPFTPFASPADLFPPRFSSSRSLSSRFISSDDQRKALVFAAGACSNDGQSEPRAGWAVVCGPTQADVVTHRLESKGPFGDAWLQTRNRAELRAVIAALRIRDWKNNAFSSIIVATNSAYVVKALKNRDLWELLLGEVERWDNQGLEVQLWKITRKKNIVAYIAAIAATDKPTVPDFGDLVFDTPTRTTAESQTRVLEICLETEDMYDNIYQRFTSGLKARATSVDRATTVEKVLTKLTQQPTPTVILVTDGAITRNKRAFDAVVDHLRKGSTAILACSFSSWVTLGEFNRFFIKLGLPWRRGPYYRTTFRLRPGASGAVPGAARLPASYSPKALLVSNVERSAAWYTEEANSREAAVAWTKVGSGHLGYVGDVNGEDGSYNVVMAMCGLL
ncbi:hypothetical protein B0H66DRAFT_573661 [Apodospora peruviana]|uniref:RNase H type-1 domain-containing protein n=1 Tax=Apodospora peruviana TaxID=516989 RepID=A0AAE0IJ66_9PEZI|nr:hypothetical protein B0H66DRAFT_573661 [Apodospora peruviana]